MLPFTLAFLLIVLPICQTANTSGGKKAGEEDIVQDVSPSDQGKNCIGCLGQSLIPHEHTYLVEFQDETSNYVDICLRTCANIYPNTSLALISWDDVKRTMDCHCSLSGGLHSGLFGPDIFCNSQCYFSRQAHKKTGCGGTHTFNNGATEMYFSVFCINGTLDNGTWPNPTTTTRSSTTTTRSSTTTSKSSTTPSDTDGTILDILHDIWRSLVETNIASIILIGLMILVIILVLVLMFWTHLFMESHDPNASARFYQRRPSNKNNSSSPKEPIIQLSQMEEANGYGATNQAFDPRPESDLPQSEIVEENPQVPRLSSTSDHSTSSREEEDEEEEEVTPRPPQEEEEGVTREGRSTFYGDLPGDKIQSSSQAEVDAAEKEAEMQPES